MQFDCLILVFIRCMRSLSNASPLPRRRLRLVHIRSLYSSDKLFLHNPLSPNSNENAISLYINTICSNIQVMTIKEVITKDKMSLYLDKFSFC